ncbi:cytochrome d ubiquinol oxidase subunit II [Pseudoxanthomonas broegbernensis]|uniref:Cytochrome d ubiquinol oxidase subunit II n=1 Tax=Pseudoxanthomonas broegbernensis TaxID=83619 RepID=A0A7V8GPM2_9GAMM|nr:cytochrome d ubiquinol oxidase subunit II [Pseudoxanthomonas broegbernensis]KAF1687712.1 cytochrome d ubiquinol oxidase subunit II [Pseudoxanthomonas broegbernensis]MBB6064744.1 cytochrome d ubiquinol oxidase subunit II [Pseudoxanthomonas broegbernensis]
MAEFIPLDYATLRVIWWLLLGLLLVGFAVMDGFDLGVGALLPFVARTDPERRLVVNTVGPVWEGNQVWLVVGGGTAFAAFPALYAVSFSGFYLAMFLILFALILRPVGFKFRGKVADPRWRATWDWALFVGGAVPALVFGVAVGNVQLGVPFHFEPATLRPVYTGGFFALLNPYALVCGLVSLSLLVAHGAAALLVKTDGPVAVRAARYGGAAALVCAVLFVAAGAWISTALPGYRIDSAIDGGGLSNPLLKSVTAAPGLWLENYRAVPALWLAPVGAVAGMVLGAYFLYLGRGGPALVCTSMAVPATVLTFGFAVFPFLLPSSSLPDAGLTLWDASSSRLTLWVMLLVTALLLPIVMLYTAWVYRVLRGKVSADSLEENPNAY